MTNTIENTTNEPAVAATEGADIAPVKPIAKKRANTKKAAPKGQKAGKSSAQFATPFDDKDANVRAQAAKVAPTKAKSGKKASRKKKASTAQAQAIRKGSKTETFLHLLTRNGGASLQTLMEATGWQAHSVRGLVLLRIWRLAA